jgi:Flp pilus assembly protein TadG
LVEVALIFLPLCALLFGIFDFSVAIFMRATMQNAVREGVRYAVTFDTLPSMCQDASIKQIVKNSMIDLLPAPGLGLDIDPEGARKYLLEEDANFFDRV